MIALDTNILIYAHRAGTARHRDAQAAITRAAARGAWGFAVSVVAEFWSQVTHPRYPGGPSSGRQAAGFLRALMEQGGARVLYPGADFAERLRDHAERLRLAGVRVFDLQIGLAAHDNGAHELWTHDADFVRLPGLRIVDPFAAE